MTNGEKFCIDFPNIRIDVFVSYVQVVGENYEFNNLYPLTWWNAEYKEPTTKNDLEVDVPDNNVGNIDCISREQAKAAIRNRFKDLPSRVEINTILNELPPVTPQEPKPMVEIDLYSVIKQKYIEREVLDKLRAEIESKYNNCDICEFVEDYDYEENDISEYRPIGDIADILEIIDKYKGENEG